MEQTDPAGTQLGALPEHCDFTVFGGTGDLALRKLLPALYHRDREGQLPAGHRIISVSRSDLDDDGYRALVADALETHIAPDDLDPVAVHRLLGAPPPRPRSTSRRPTTGTSCTACSRTDPATTRPSASSTSPSRPPCSARSAAGSTRSASSTSTPAW